MTIGMVVSILHKGLGGISHVYAHSHRDIFDHEVFRKMNNRSC